MNPDKSRLELDENGYAIVPNIYSHKEVNQILSCLEKQGHTGKSFSKSDTLFAIRQLILNVPELSGLLFNPKLVELISGVAGTDYFLTKAIYFDKPSGSNWFVAYHQDLSISVDKKVELENYVNWTMKNKQYGVQPPIEILNDTLTVRIHLDDTNKSNGALKVIPKSHLNGVVRIDSKSWDCNEEHICDVKKGGVMLMKPLTLHASNRTVNEKRRRVIHLEFNRHQLAKPLLWSEFRKIEF